MHHYSDIISGALLGTFVSYFTYTLKMKKKYEKIDVVPSSLSSPDSQV